MSVALYRKHRPESFSDIIGQEHIVSVLSKTIQDGSVSHAYLFSGSRGLGKTTIARILAREIGTTDRDVYEIDAASNRGIDDIRALREEVNALPFESSFKVYIIDEVHMLTKEAFNALLKTLEEPPRHVKFVLATTEMHKLPDTVVSRCEVHQFKKPTRSILSSHVQNIATKEGYTVEPAGADLIALIGNGSYRDALGVLQKVLSSVEKKKVSEADVERVTGVSSSVSVMNVVKAIGEGNLSKAFEEVHTVVESGADISIFTTRIIETLRYILLIRHAPDMQEYVEARVRDDELTSLTKLAKEGKRISSKTLSRFLSALDDIGATALPEVPLELALIDVVGDNAGDLE